MKNAGKPIPPGGIFEFLLTDEDAVERCRYWDTSSAGIENLFKNSANLCVELRSLTPRREVSVVVQPRPATAESRRSGIKFALSDWGELNIRFLSDERVQIMFGTETATLNYAEFGFEDGRSKKPNSAWVALRALAEQEGIIREPENGQNWSSVEKRMQEIRKIFKRCFQLVEDPLPFVDGLYRARFKIICAPSFES